MKTYEIQYINRLHEEKTYASEVINAKNEIIALKKFALIFHIKDYKQLMNEDFMWEDGNWYAKFKCINEVK